MNVPQNGRSFAYMGGNLSSEVRICFRLRAADRLRAEEVPGKGGGRSATAPLVVFFPGTGGKPEGTRRLFNVVAQQGYRVIGLEYNDVPSVQQVCPLTPK